jgi:hypothetical protein
MWAVDQRQNKNLNGLKRWVNMSCRLRSLPCSVVWYSTPGDSNTKTRIELIELCRRLRLRFDSAFFGRDLKIVFWLKLKLSRWKKWKCNKHVILTKHLYEQLNPNMTQSKRLEKLRYIKVNLKNFVIEKGAKLFTYVKVWPWIFTSQKIPM